MQVNFMHNYSKTFFKGSSPSSKTEAPPNEPLTAEKFGDFARQQAWHNQAVLETLKAILELLQPPATPSIGIKGLEFKNKEAYTHDGKEFSGVAISTLKNGDIIEHTYASGRLKHVSRKGEEAFEKEYVYDERGLKEVIAETKYGTNITTYARNNKPGLRVIGTESGVYEGSYLFKNPDKESIEKLTLNGENIIETYTREDGSVVIVDNNKATTTIDYSNCSGRDENAPIKEIYKIYKGCSDKKLAERHWKNGDYEYFDKNGELTETKRMKRDGSYIKFSRKRDLYRRLIVDEETFPPKPEGKKTKYPEQFEIHPCFVECHENGNLSFIFPDYGRGNHRYERIRSFGWDGAAMRIENYSCPLHKIYFYPTGKIKSEHYGIDINSEYYILKIEFNENGQVDNVIITNGHNDDDINKEASSRIKERLIKAGYEGYAKYVEDFKERAEIAYSVRKRSEETPQ